MRYATLLVPCMILSGAGVCAAFGPGGGGRSSPVPTVGRACNGRCGVWGLRSPPPLRERCPRSILYSASSDDGDTPSGSRRGRPKLTDDEIDRRKEQLRILLCATKGEIDQLARNKPTVLYRRDIVASHGPKLTMLQKRLGISQKAAGKMCLKTNSLLDMTLETLESKLQWLQTRLNLDKVDLWKVIKRDPTILDYSRTFYQGNTGPSVDTMQSGLELSDEELTKVVVRTPVLLLRNFSTEKLAARLSFLRNLLNIEENDLAGLRKVILRQPSILVWSEESMLESQQWMKDRLGLGDARISQMSRNAPQLLILKLETLEKKADWLQKELNLHDKELSKMISVKPEILDKSMEKKVRPLIKYLRRTFQLNDEEVKDLLLRCYTLFNYSIDKNLEPKLEFYSKLVGKAVAKETMLEKLNCFNASLKTRLKPRLAEVEERGDRIRWTKTLLIRLATRPPEQWETYGLGDAPRGGTAVRAKKKTERRPEAT